MNTPADKPDQASAVDPGAIDLEPIKENWQHKGFAPRYTIMSLVAAVEALREQIEELKIEKQGGWECLLKRAEAAEARVVELAGALEEARLWFKRVCVAWEPPFWVSSGILAATPEDALARARVMKEVVSTLEQIAQFQRDKCENAGAEILFMLLDNKVCAAVAALAKLDALGEEET